MYSRARLIQKGGYFQLDLNLSKSSDYLWRAATLVAELNRTERHAQKKPIEPFPACFAQKRSAAAERI